MLFFPLLCSTGRVEGCSLGSLIKAQTESLFDIEIQEPADLLQPSTTIITCIATNLVASYVLNQLETVANDIPTGLRLRRPQGSF